MRFIPHVTVATIVEDQGRYLMVEELSNNRVVFNQPAGHLEADESLIQAAHRETLEETAWTVEITGITGVYLFRGENGVTYQRTCFTALPLAHQPELELDRGILRAHWMTLDEIRARQAELRSPLVLECILDYLNKPRYPLDLIR
ncbi:NUDIX hydrolase [Pseudomonas sp. MYb185]|uniref:NUDIX hydrolase n=1 Tax=Pseudomonas sp. MYb185 TaxID=1848729 RepID=UPI000CFC50CE|nr:NUDIX hydrolase [Pseudomonas sp. MYb185]PRB77133.1 NUDIX hydrolase [Pseudomonas sp. MYb185]